MNINQAVAGYRYVYLQHSGFEDEDVVQKIFTVDNVTSDLAKVRRDNDLNTYFYTLGGLTPGNHYYIKGAFIDAMVDDTAIKNKFGMSFSDQVSINTHTPPSIVSATSDSRPVDIGIPPSTVTLTLDGYADTVTVLKRLSTSNDDSDFESVYVGGFMESITVDMAPGTYDIKIIGTIALPDGITIESEESPIEENVLVEEQFFPPEAPTDLEFKVAQIQDTFERYDVRVEWLWSRGDGSNVREFVTQYVTLEEFGNSGWTKAQSVSSASAMGGVISNFPYGIAHRFRVGAIAWGPDTEATTWSEETNFTITETTPLDSSFVDDTDIEVTYSHIRAFTDVDGVKTQTFNVDAATGNVSIGAYADGGYPISLDPTSGDVNVRGRTISEEIIGASFVMANLTGQNNPELRSISKDSYGSTASGIWMGYENDGKWKLDIGNSANHLRWDGDSLTISSAARIGLPSGDTVGITEGIKGIYEVSAYLEQEAEPATPDDNTVYPPSGWSSTPIYNENKVIWITKIFIDPTTNKPAEGYSYTTPYQVSGKTTYTWTVYATDSNGSNISTIPSGRTYIGQKFNQNEPTPSMDPTDYNWVKYVGTDGIDGNPGADGLMGAGFYTQSIYNLSAFNTTQAASFFQTNFGRYANQYDTLTQYRTGDPTIAFTKQWIGDSWVEPALIVHGNMVVDGTVTSDKLVANTITGREISSGTTILAGSGSWTAGLNGDHSAGSSYSPWTIWSGADNPANASFRVDRNGYVYASNGYFAGELGAETVRTHQIVGGAVTKMSTITSSTGVTLPPGTSAPLGTYVVSWPDSSYLGTSSVHFVLNFQGAMEQDGGAVTRGTNVGIEIWDSRTGTRMHSSDITVKYGETSAGSTAVAALWVPNGTTFEVRLRNNWNDGTIINARGSFVALLTLK